MKKTKENMQWRNETGFTLIEVMIAMVIALVVLAGMSSLFVSQNRTASALSQKSELMNDLFLASQIIQFELRGAKAVCWESANSLIRYQPITSSSDLTSACSADNAVNGFFQMMPIDLINNMPTPFIYWDRPFNVDGRQELIRSMKANTGMTITPTSNTDLQAVRKVTLTSQYLNKDKQIKDISLSFKVWPRNVQ